MTLDLIIPSHLIGDQQTTRHFRLVHLYRKKTGQ